MTDDMFVVVVAMCARCARPSSEKDICPWDDCPGNRCKSCGGPVPLGEEGRMSGLCQRCLNGPAVSAQ